MLRFLAQYRGIRADTHLIPFVLSMVLLAFGHLAGVFEVTGPEGGVSKRSYVLNDNMNVAHTSLEWQSANLYHPSRVVQAARNFPPRVDHLQYHPSWAHRLGYSAGTWINPMVAIGIEM